MAQASWRLAHLALSRTVRQTMDRKFAARVETFGLDTSSPWALDALRLLFSTPRAYRPLVEAWDERYPGTRRALDKLVRLGLVAYQPGVVVDTSTGLPATTPTRRVPRYRTTAKGGRLLAAIRDDVRVLEDTFPRAAFANSEGIIALLNALHLEDSHAKFGMSAARATELSGLPNSNVKWWIRSWKERGYVRELPEKYSDVREVVPAHWRITRGLCKQLTDVIGAFESAPDSLRGELRLNRDKFLSDIEPVRVGISGATDFDHDVECQRVLAALLRSPRYVPEGIFVIEPKIALPVDTSTRPWEFSRQGDGRIYYQPDAELRERDDIGISRTIVEYERFQTRKDAWNHIERLLGYVWTSMLPFERVALRFVVDSAARERSYKDLIGAFATHLEEMPHLCPRNQVTLSVSSVPRLLAAADPFDESVWIAATVSSAGSDTEPRPALHPSDDTPYYDWFNG